MSRQMTGAEMIVEALKDQGVDTIFGYPGGAVLPIYDALFHQNKVRHVLVRHEQGAGHAAEGYARSTGKVGVLLVTSGPGATNAVTALSSSRERARIGFLMVQRPPATASVSIGARSTTKTARSTSMPCPSGCVSASRTSTTNNASGSSMP